jgi:UDP-N-acetylmuramyl tripeptide synthase
VTRASARTRVAVTAGRATGWLSRVTGRGQGATISGRVMNRIAPGALAELARDQHVTLISATNGKTTTTRFLAAALRADDRPLVTNATGANLTSGIAPILASAQGPGTAVLEVDERVLPRVVDPLRAELLVLGNLSRDQLDRYGEVHAVGGAWRRVAEQHPGLAVVANAADPHVVWAAEPAATVWVDLGAGWRNDAATCPRCGALLHWDDRGFECGSCRFAPPATRNRLDGDVLVLDGERVPLTLALPGRWNLANAALAVTAAVTQFGIDAAVAARAAAGVETVAGRYMRVPLGDGRYARVLLAKNPAGWTEVLHYLADRPGSVVIAVNARVADGKDPSWLWDVPYELLRGHATAAAGDRCLDVAVRLRYAEVDHVVRADPIAAARELPGDEVHIVASYTQFSALYRRHGTPGHDRSGPS